MREYKIIETDDGVQECDSCGYPSPLCDFMVDGRETRMLCEVCSSTFISSQVEFTSQFSNGERKILKAIGWCTNKILSEIRELKGDNGDGTGG